jgi:AcrR family transcriptional regulator
MKTTPAAVEFESGRTKPGRKRDPEKDDAILRAALDVLAESGYEGTTIDVVAAKAGVARATVYRRWPTKSELIVDAVRALAQLAPKLQLPDTGTLEGDMRLLLSAGGRSGNARPMKIIVGLLPAMPHDPELAEVVSTVMIAPQAALFRALLQRAQDRGEIGAHRNLDMLALIVPAFSSYRAIILGGTLEQSYVDAVIDEILLPAIRG